jgi:hypothetical protein
MKKKKGTQSCTEDAKLHRGKASVPVLRLRSPVIFSGIAGMPPGANQGRR